MRSRSRASTPALARSSRYLRSTCSMNAEREFFDPARRSTFSKTSFESVIEVFSFILPSYYRQTPLRKVRSSGGNGGGRPERGQVKKGLTRSWNYCIFCNNRNDRYNESDEKDASHG